MKKAHQWWRSPSIGPSVWAAADLFKDESWVRQVAPAELDQLRDVMAEVLARRRRAEQKPPDAFSLPGWASTIEAVHSQVHAGRGLFLLRGLNVEECDREMLEVLYFGLACRLGSVLTQNSDGDFIRRVTDAGEQLADKYQARSHRGRGEMLPHSDSADIVGLFCVRPAKCGGGTRVCSSAAVFNEIVERHPEHLDALRNGFYFDLTGKSAAGVSERRLPVFAYERGRVVCQFNKSRIEAGMSIAGVGLTHTETAALEYVNQLAVRPDLALHFELRSGDILFLNNNYVLHARDAYEDWPEPDRKRLLLRIWLKR